MFSSDTKKQSSVYVRNLVRIVIVFGLIVFTWSTVRIFFGYVYAQKRLESTKENYQKASGEYNKLKDQYTNLTTKDGMEYYIRDQYRAVAAGEQLVVLIDDQADQKIKLEKQKSWWNTLLDRF